VTKDTSLTEFVVHTSPGDGAPPNGNVKVRAKGSDWIPHPDDKVDLCALPMAPVMTAPGNPKLFFKTLDSSLVPSQSKLEELDAVEDVLMVGYPTGLWDQTNNYPLIRRGITSSHPAVDHLVDGIATTVVDIACFPGSSGSPVFVYNTGTYGDKKGNVTVGRRLLFIGVLYAGPQFAADGQIVIRNIPTEMEAIPQIKLMMNLGYLIKSRELAALEAAIMGSQGKK
jgi:hypothetical protein